MKRIVSSLLLMLIAVPLFAGDGRIRRAGEPVPNQYIALLADEAAGDPDCLAADVAQQYGVDVRAIWKNALRGFAFDGTEAQAEEVSGDARVRSVEEDGQVISAAAVGDNWGLDRIDNRVNPRLDFNYNSSKTGSGVFVYVVDSGVWAGHDQFSEPDPAFPNKPRVRGGYDAYLNEPFPCARELTNYVGSHGTAVASVLAGKTFGAAPSATIVPVRVLPCHGGSPVSVLVDGLEWIVEGTHDYVPGHGRVVNMSHVTVLGEPESGTNRPLAEADLAAVDLAVQGLLNAGITVVAAAGNCNQPILQTFSPARMQGIITVGGTQGHLPEHPDARWVADPFSQDCRQNAGSNYGPMVDIFAPAHRIRVAHWDTASGERPIDSPLSSGTSFAAPLVAGVAARILQDRPSYNCAQVQSRLIETATTEVNGLNILNRGDSPNRLLFACPDIPLADIIAIPSVSAGSTQNRALTADPTSLPRAWTISNGAITSYDAHGIHYTAGTSGNVTLTVTVGTGQCGKTTTRVIPICTTTVAPAAGSIPAMGGFRSFALTSGCSWNVRSNAPWLSVYSAPSGTGNATVTVGAPPNPDSAPRTGTVEAGGNIVTVTQLGRVSIRSDFNRDGRADHLVLHRSLGEVTLRLMNGPAVDSEVTIGTAHPQLRTVGTGDLNGDGFADIVMRDPLGPGVLVWLLDGTQVLDDEWVIPDQDANWRAQAVADFNGDGKADILWRHATTHALDTTYMNGTTVISRFHHGNTNANWHVADVGDFNGDGKSDTVWRSTVVGNIHVALTGGAGAVSPSLPANWSLTVADVDGDAKSDLVWKDSNSGETRIDRLDGLTVVQTGVALNESDTTWPIHGAGDFDGDGATDLFWWKPSGAIRIVKMNGIASAIPQTVGGIYPASVFAITSPVTPRTAHSATP